MTVIDQRQAGQEAFAAYWDSRGKTEWSDPLDTAFAAGVVDAFIARWSALGLAAEALEGGRAKAGEKHVEPLDAILELLQNADDQHAKHATLLLKGNELLFVHDGERIQLPHVPAIVMPYLSTKRGDAGSLGRFGIGLKTLGALGDHLGVHGPPYHFSADRDGPGRSDPRRRIPDVYETDGRHTLFALRLHDNAIDPDNLLAWVEGLGTAGIVFLSDLRELTVRAGDRTVHLKAGRGGTGTSGVCVEVSHVTGGGGWQVYTRTRTPPEGLAPKDKAREDQIEIGIALSNVADGGRICIGLPIERRMAAPMSVHAPFDPDDARRDLLHTGWNEWLFDQLAELLAQVVQIRYGEDARRVWRAIPLSTELRTGHKWLDGQLAKLREAAVSAVADAEFQPPNLDENETDFAHCRYKPGWLDGLVSPELLTVQHLGVVPGGLRDAGGRWRRVLRDAKLGRELKTSDVISLAELDDRVAHLPPTWWARLTAAYLAQAKNGELESARTLVLNDGSRVSPEDVDSGLILTRAETAAPIPVLARLHPEYLTGPDADRLASWLAEAGRLADAPSDQHLLKALATWSGDPLPLYDDALGWLHRAIWTSDARQRESLGRDIGVRISLDGFRYTAEGRESCRVVPGAAYMPSSVTHQADSFAKAAAATIGLNWLASRHDKMLQASSDADRGGALATLRLLGAMTTPHLTKRSTARWNRYGTRAYRLDPDAGELQRSRIAEIRGYPEALRRDWGCQDLIRVAKDIEADTDDDGRSARARALFATLCREWENEYADRLEAVAVRGYYDWKKLGRVPATWRSKLAECRWLSGRDGPAAPRVLALRTPSLETAHGEEPDYALEAGASDPRAEVVAKALGMETRPTASGLVEELKDLRERTDEFSELSVATRAKRLMASLALLCPPLSVESISVDDSVGDFTIRQLQATFGIARNKRGLIFADSRWWPRTAAVLGTPVFGRFRARAPDVAPLNRLWRVLGIATPTLDDCAKVLEDMSGSPLADDDVGTYIAVLRLAADLLSEGDTSKRLETAPVWGGSSWITDRPVLAVRDPTIASALRDHHMVWDPRCDLDTLGTLPGALGVEEITPADLRLKNHDRSAERQGDLFQSKFHRAVFLYRELCATDAPEVYAAMDGQWDDLAEAILVVSPDLTVKAHLPTGTADIAVEAFSTRDPAVVAVRHDDFLGSRDLGRCIASAWLRGSGEDTPDQVKAALLWREVWQQAEEGRGPSGLALPSAESSDADLEELAAHLRARDLPPPKSRGRRPESEDAPRSEPVIIRLKSPDSVRPEEDILITGGTSEDDQRSDTKGPARPLKPPQDIVVSGKTRASAPRTLRAPDRDPEAVAMGLLKQALRSVRVRDFRNQRGIGADAIDDMLGFIEMKHSRDGIPTKVSLTSAQFDRAKELRERFVLAIVAGLEEGTRSIVRLYRDPISSLRVEAPGGITVSGLNDAPFIEIPLVDLDEETPQS